MIGAIIRWFERRRVCDLTPWQRVCYVAVNVKRGLGEREQIERGWEP